MALQLWKRSKEKKAEKLDVVLQEKIGTAPPTPFWTPPEENDVTTANSVWSVRFSGRIRVGTNQAFKSLEEALAVCTLWEKEYNGFAGKRPFYRVIIMMLVRKMSPPSGQSRTVDYFEYVSECKGTGNFIYNMGDLPAMVDGEDKFYQSWDFRGKSGFIRVEINIQNMEENLSYPVILSPNLFSNVDEFVSSAKIFGVHMDKEDINWVLLK